MQSLLKRKELIYMIFRRYPMEMQENLDNRSFMEISKPWRCVIEYYWERRYNNAMKGKTTVAHRNYVTKFGRAIKCVGCSRPFSEGSVTLCWRCHKYTCWDCCDPANSAIYYCSCNQHQKKCKKCRNPFIPYSTNDFEVYCFPCQHQTGMLDEMWHTVPLNSQLPYGTFEMRRTFREYIQSLRTPEENQLYSIATDNGVIITTTSRIGVGLVNITNNNNALDQNQDWENDYEYYFR